MSYLSSYPPGCTARDIDDFYEPDEVLDCDAYEGTGLLAREATAALASPFTLRQQPVAMRFDLQLNELASMAESINDNALEERTPLCSDVARHWMRRLDEVRTSIFNAQAAARGQ